MPTAFGRAMLATINGQPQRFRMSMQDGPSIEMDCRDCLTVRTEEAELIDELALPEEGSVLDWGCGVGRHLARVRQRYPSVHCVGIDTCDLLLDYCRRTIADPATFVTTYDAVADQQFDLIRIMGSSLGVLGSEQEATDSLRRLVEALRPNGRIVIETGNPFGTGYFSAQFVIDYEEHRDGPFTWAYADRDWISRTLSHLGFNVNIRASSAPGGGDFCHAARRRPANGAGGVLEPTADIPGQQDVGRPLGDPEEVSRTWVYFAARALAGQATTIQFAVDNHVIYRSSRNVNGALIANVGNLQPGDRILLVYRGHLPHVVRVCARIGHADNPAPGTTAVQRIRGALAAELFAAGYTPVDNDVAEVIPLEDVLECHLVLHGQYLGIGTIRALEEVDEGFESHCPDLSGDVSKPDSSDFMPQLNIRSGKCSGVNEGYPAGIAQLVPVRLPSGGQPQFDAYVMIDWSAQRTPATGQKSIWIGLGVWRDRVLMEWQENPPTRMDCMALLQTQLDQLRREGKKVLVGLDFAFGYPQGFPRVLGVVPDCWHGIWAEFRRHVCDDLQNHHNRDQFAAACNQRIEPNTAGPFWGCPVSGAVPGVLTVNRVGIFLFPYHGLAAFRHTEVRARQQGATPQSVWKLNQGVSVGGQTILGIRHLADFVFRQSARDGIRVWPFETGWSLPSDAKIVFAEIFPSVVSPEDGEDVDRITDRAQVRRCVRYAARKDADEVLNSYFAQPQNLAAEDAYACVAEEGWILFVL